MNSKIFLKYLNNDARHADASARERVPVEDLVDVAVEAESEEVCVDDRVPAQDHGAGPYEPAANISIRSSFHGIF